MHFFPNNAVYISSITIIRKTVKYISDLLCRNKVDKYCQQIAGTISCWISLLLINNKLFNTNFQNYFLGGNLITVWSTSTIREDEGSGNSCFIIFPSLFMIHCWKPPTALCLFSPSFENYSVVEVEKAKVWIRSSSSVFRFFIPRYSALSSSFVHLNLGQKLMVKNLIIM